MATRAVARIVVSAAALPLLACGGSRSTPAASAPAPAGGAAAMAAAPSNALPAGVTAAMVSAGDSLFNAPRSCNGCHGKGGVDGRNGPNLTTGKYEHVDGSYASIVHVITVGIPKDSIKHAEHRFPMRPQGGHDYSDEQIANLAAYVWTLGHHG
ncbi:MAG: cytochrome c [Gemmatimonadota bacterium]|nr:cytochrome c [Gemmatimonadota bacterium]